MKFTLKRKTIMAKANLSQKATLASMQRLDPGISEIERAGHEPITDPEVFAGRNGYNPDFLNGWGIVLPTPTGSRREDVCELKRGGDGFELAYRNFSVIMSKSRRLPILTAANISGSEARRVPRISTWSFDGRLDKEE